jgi:DNA-directed RNA polymerase specialized sigma24 family protein
VELLVNIFSVRQCACAANCSRSALTDFYYPIRAPPLLKFWFSQNFKRLEESRMGFNCAQEKAKFDREWLRLRKEYTDDGMSEAAIQKIYDYDWYCFCRNRAYERRVTQMPPLEIDSPDDERRSALFRKNEALSASFDESAFPGRYAWIDTLEDARLLRAIMKLNKKDLELLTYVTLEGHGQEELARRWGCTQAAVAIRMKKIKKIFQTTL